MGKVSGDVVLKRDESGIKRMPTFFIWVMPVCFVVLIGGTVAFVASMFTHSSTMGVAAIILIVFSGGFGWFCDIYYDAYENVRYKISSGKLIYEYDLNGAVVPSKDITVKYEIDGVTKYRLGHSGKTVKIRGSILEKRPLRQKRKVSKLEARINLDTESRQKILSALEDLKEDK